MPEWLAIWVLVTLGLALLGIIVGTIADSYDTGLEVALGVVQGSCVILLLLMVVGAAIASLV